MGELERRRRARSLWVSQGHLAAAGVLALFLIGLAFAIGYWTGARSAQATSHERVEMAGTHEVVDLLARVDAGRRAGAGDEALTFPHTLRGEETVGPAAVRVIEDPEANKEPSSVAVRPDGAAALAMGVASTGRFSVLVASNLSQEQGVQDRKKLGEKAWLQGKDTADGKSFELWFGGFADAAEAEDALGLLKEDFPTAKAVDRQAEAPPQ